MSAKQPAGSRVNGEEAHSNGGAAQLRSPPSMPVDQNLQKAKMAKRQKDKEEKEARDAEKLAKKELAEKKEQLAKAKADREKAKAAKAAGGGAKAAAGPDVAALEKQFMPLVKQGQGLQDGGDLAGAMALYQQAMDGFRAAGVKRPKLKQKMVRATRPLRAPCPPTQPFARTHALACMLPGDDTSSPGSVERASGSPIFCWDSPVQL